jgi:hypothetical protein
MNIAGCIALRNDAGVQADLLKRAQRIAQRAGEGNVADVRAGKTRCHAMVKAMTPKAVHACYASNTLLKSMDAGR